MGSFLDRRGDWSGDGDARFAHETSHSNGSHGDLTIVIVESSAFIRDCILRSARGLTPKEPMAFSSLQELRDYRPDQQPAVSLVSIMSLSAEEVDREFALLSQIDPQLKTLVLAPADDLNRALAALSQGANGFISINVGFEIVMQALRFVSSGGTYVPAQCLLAAKREFRPRANKRILMPSRRRKLLLSRRSVRASRTRLSLMN